MATNDLSQICSGLQSAAQIAQLESYFAHKMNLINENLCIFMGDVHNVEQFFAYNNIIASQLLKYRNKKLNYENAIELV